MSIMIHTLAVLQARDEVKDQIRKAGHKLYEYKAKDLMAMAHARLESERERLVADTRAKIASSPSLMEMYLAEQRHGQNRKDRASASADHTSLQRGV
jgi:hypothetical protein